MKAPISERARGGDSMEDTMTKTTNRMVEVTLNGSGYYLDSTPIAFETICALAGRPGEALTVTYWRADKSGGVLSEGEALYPSDGMVIVVVDMGEA